MINFEFWKLGPRAAGKTKAARPNIEDLLKSLFDLIR